MLREICDLTGVSLGRLASFPGYSTLMLTFLSPFLSLLYFVRSFSPLYLYLPIDFLHVSSFFPCSATLSNIVFLYLPLPTRFCFLSFALLHISPFNPHSFVFHFTACLLNAPPDGNQSRSKQFAVVRCLATTGRSGRVRIRDRPTENWTGMFVEPDCQIVCNELPQLQLLSRIVSPGISGPATHRLKIVSSCFCLIANDGFSSATIFQSFDTRKWHPIFVPKSMLRGNEAT